MLRSLSFVLMRRIWLRLHLSLALVAGLLFALIGATGSLSLYRDSIDRLLNPRLVVEVPAGQRYQSLDKIIAAVRAAEPKRHGAWTLEMPLSADGVITAWFDKPHETIDELYAPLMVSVNPYNAEVLASRFWGDTLATWLLDVHTQLRGGREGWQWVGGCGGLLALSVLSGAGLWWTDRQALRQRLRIRTRQGLIRLGFDLHRLGGLLFTPLLLLLALSGVCLSFPPVLETLTGSADIGHSMNQRSVHSSGQPNNRPIQLEEAVLLARGLFPSAQLRRVTTPVGDEGVYVVNFRQTGEVAHKHPVTTVWIDRWSGHIQDAVPYSSLSARAKWGAKLWPLHSAELLSSGGRLLWFVTGLMPLALYLSGLLFWLTRKGWIDEQRFNYAVATLSYRGRLQLRHWLGHLPPLRQRALSYWRQLRQRS